MFNFPFIPNSGSNGVIDINYLTSTKSIEHTEIALTHHAPYYVPEPK
ncbi:hypothetical protein KCM76_19875 [Zooshikella marina]|nr:hypothetical protein [Zooshikella ganghwensis]MBU2708260.1 hypothetical protein [Zooshikella ganghwensis]